LETSPNVAFIQVRDPWKDYGKCFGVQERTCSLQEYLDYTEPFFARGVPFEGSLESPELHATLDSGVQVHLNFPTGKFKVIFPIDRFPTYAYQIGDRPCPECSVVSPTERNKLGDTEEIVACFILQETRPSIGDSPSAR